MKGFDPEITLLLGRCSHKLKAIVILEDEDEVMRKFARRVKLRANVVERGRGAVERGGDAVERGAGVVERAGKGCVCESREGGWLRERRRGGFQRGMVERAAEGYG